MTPSSRGLCLSELELNHSKVLKREKHAELLAREPELEAVLAPRPAKGHCEACSGRRLQAGPARAEKGVLLPRCPLTRDLAEKPKPWPPGEKPQPEPEGTAPLCKAPARLPPGTRDALVSEERPLPEAPRPGDTQWHDVSAYLGLASCPGTRQPEQLAEQCRGHMEMAGDSCCQRAEACPGDGATCEAPCCHPSNLVVEAPGPVSDAEWMSIFKPSRTQRIVRHRSVCTCSGSVRGTKYNASTRWVRVTPSVPGRPEVASWASLGSFPHSVAGCVCLHRDNQIPANGL